MILEKTLRHFPADQIKYLIPAEAIYLTEKVLSEYGNLSPSNEGLVYWAGIKRNNEVSIDLVIAPKTESASRRVVTTPESNVRVVQTLSNSNMIHLGQVHSHPGNWVDHSDGDDKYAAFKINGLLSIVVPDYCSIGMLPLSICGIHRFDHNEFIRLDDAYISERFIVLKEKKCRIEDLRNEKL
jgi:hypothetical protein